MKIFSLFISVVICSIISSSNLFGQNPIPNSGFESWSGNVPNGWSATANNPGFWEPITQSTDAYSGTYAVRGEVLNVGGSPYPPALYTGSPTQQTFPVSESHNSFTGYYKFSPQGGDNLYIQIVFINTNIGGGAEGHAAIAAGSSSYQEIEIEMIYDDDNPPGWKPDQGNITVSILPPEGQAPNIGTWFLVDNFTFDGYPLGVEETDNGKIPEQFSLEQNYPNPFNPITNINFSMPEESFVNLKIFNLQGEEIVTLVNEELSAGTYKVDWNASEMPSGVYVYVLKTKNNILSYKMVLMK